jgi:DEAD/DEAH box helicase domain-containing protein
MEVPAGRAAAVDALRGIGVALETVATLALMCDPRDLGTTLGEASVDEDGKSIPQAVPRKADGGPTPGYSPTLFVYEHTPGGIGLSERIFEQKESLVMRVLKLIEGCPCVRGCPACVGPSDAILAFTGGIEHTRKSVALELLRSALPTA